MLILRASEAAYIKSREASTAIRAISAWRCDLIGINSEHAAFHEGSRRSKLVRFPTILGIRPTQSAACISVVM